MSKDVELLEKYNETWEKVKNSIKKEFDSEPVFYDKYLKAKLKSFQGKSTQIFMIMKYQREVLNLFAYQ